jgi:transcription factor E
MSKKRFKNLLAKYCYNLVRFISCIRYRKVLKGVLRLILTFKMQIKFLKSIVENLTNKPSVDIVDLLVGKKDVNEFLIAKKLELTINQTRNILYKLSDYGLVSFIRKKDKRKGWYIYFWTLNIAKSLNLLEQKLKEELHQLESQLKSRNEKRYYNCKTCSIEITEEVALLNDFACPECEEIYELSNNEEIIKKLERNIIKLKKEIKIVSEEREKEEEKVEKKKAKKIEKAEKEKARKRKENRKKTMAKKKAEKNKELKKKVKKKPKKKKIAKKKSKKKLKKKANSKKKKIKKK